MAVDLATKYLPYVDDLFKEESRKDLVTNQDFKWDGANTVKIYRISSAPMQDYGRTGPQEGNISRYGAIDDLTATTQAMMLSKDRSFIFNVDRMDTDETVNQLEAASALARQLREVVIPEVDAYTYGKIVAGAGTKATAVALTPENIYKAIIDGTNVLDGAEVPENQRVLVVTPDTYHIMKQSKDIMMETDIAENMRLRGVISYVDGLKVQRVPANRLPENFGFMIVHPSATVAPVKLEDYQVHTKTPLSSGAIVTGRICYDAFVLENKKVGIYYQPVTAGA